MSLEKLFDGLLGYEIVLLALGTLLFLVVLLLLICNVIRDRAYSGLLMFLLVPIAMIGYPGIQKLKFENGIVEIERYQKVEAKLPASPDARKQVEETLEFVNRRATTPRTKIGVANTYRVLGDTDKAYGIARKIDVAGAPPEVSHEIAAIYASKLGETLPADPAARASDPGQKAEISNLAREIQKRESLGAETHVRLARAYVALGEPALAAKNLDAAKAIEPDVAVDPRLSEAIRGTPGG